MTLTRNSKVFTVVTTLISVGYFVGVRVVSERSHFENAVTSSPQTFILPLLYVGAILACGKLLIREEDSPKHRGDIGLLYHQIAAAIAISVGALATLFLAYIGWRYLAWVIVVVLSSLVMRLIFYRGKIKQAFK